MGKLKEIKEKNGELKIFSINDKSHTKNLVCTINIKKEKIEYHYGHTKSKIPKITLKGFDSVPSEFKWNGHTTKQILKLFNFKLRKSEIGNFVISRKEKTAISKSGSKINILINIKDINLFKSNLQAIINENGRDKRIITNEFFNTINSNIFKTDDKNLKLKAKNIAGKLDESMISSLDSKDKERISNIFLSVFTNSSKNISQTKIKLDFVTIKSVINDFENLLSKKGSEYKWGKFLEKNIYLINSKYIETIPEINVTLGGARKVDFGLIDFQGYLDIFEIKLPTTRLLSSKTDRGNFFWHSDAVKAIVQLENYLYNTENKSNHLKEDTKHKFEEILKKKNIDLKIVKPKAILILGHSKQLETEKKKKDFRILRSSLKNIEILLYDELLEQLKNLLRKNHK